jgi:hypothetical protein
LDKKIIRVISYGVGFSLPLEPLGNFLIKSCQASHLRGTIKTPLAEPCGKALPCATQSVILL